MSAGTQKQINDLKIRMEKEKAKRDKLLELYLDGTIEKHEFTERNDTSNVLISQLEDDIFRLEEQNTRSNEYLHEIRNIERYFKEMYKPDGDMTKDQVDEMAKAIIDRIDVIPKNKENMRLEIKLKTGLNRDFTYVRAGERYGCRSGHISKKMIAAYKQGMTS